MSAPASAAARPFATWTEVLTEPRRVVVHFVRLDLASPDYALRALVAGDPDGDGPAEAALTDPLALAASRPGIVAAVNANAFRPVPDAAGRLDANWHAGQPVDIVGLAAADGVVRSPGEQARAALWTSRDRPAAPTAHITTSTCAIAPFEAVSDWNARLLDAGAIVAPPTTATHPRTLAGLDASRRWLLLAVADGRQPGYSDGLTLRESAAVLARHGCADGLNLDGGGSSILLLADAATTTPLRIANRPSGGSPRPVPVMLGIERRQK